MGYSRQRTLGRYGQPTPPTITPFTFPASTGGVNAVDGLMLMPPTDCIYTTNLMPSEYGLRLRKGYQEWATGCVEDPPRAPDSNVNSIIPFESNVQDVSNDRLFAVTAEGIWDVTLQNTTNPVQEVTFAQTSNPAGFGVWTEFTGDAAGDGGDERGCGGRGDAVAMAAVTGERSGCGGGGGGDRDGDLGDGGGELVR